MPAPGRSRTATMCEILGVTADHQYCANPLLERFYEHSSIHKDGWGLAVFNGMAVSFKKEPIRATESQYLRKRLSRSIESKNLFAHIRYATVGRTIYVNCHPFLCDDVSGRTWTMMHNGTIFIPGGTYKFEAEQKGTTDSERILLYIVSRANDLMRTCGEGCTDDPEVRFRLVECVLAELSRGNKLNVLLYDGEYMYIHSNCPGTLYECEQDGVRVFATKPVYIDPSKWKPVKNCSLTVYKDGELRWEGTKHMNEFDESSYELMFLQRALAEQPEVIAR